MKFYLKRVLRVDYHPKTDKEVDNIEKADNVELENNIEVQKINEDLNSFPKTDEDLNSFEKKSEEPIKENNEISNKSLEENNTDEIPNKIIEENDPN